VRFKARRGRSDGLQMFRRRDEGWMHAYGDHHRFWRASRQTPAFKWVNTALGNISRACWNLRAVRKSTFHVILAEFEYRFNHDMISAHDPASRLGRAENRSYAIPLPKLVTFRRNQERFACIRGASTHVPV